MTDSTVELKSQLCLNGKYIIQHTLGVGGFGITYVAYDMEAKRNCAVKELFPQGIVTRTMDGMNVAVVSTDKQETFEHSKERFLEEAEILQSLNPVKEVVSVYDFFMENGTCYFVMEYLEGENLIQSIAAGRKFGRKGILKMGREIASGLQYLHESCGMVYRDLKPANLIFCKNGRVKLIDAGCICKLGERKSLAGSPGFAAPEQLLAGVEADAESDVYGLAKTLESLLGDC